LRKRGVVKKQSNILIFEKLKLEKEIETSFSNVILSLQQTKKSSKFTSTLENIF
jgi:predicted CopG family antitoxin